MEEKELEKGEQLTKKEKILIYSQAYAPAIGMGLATVLCIITVENRQKELISAYNLLEKNFNRYRRKLIEMDGIEKDEEIISELTRTYSDCHTTDINTPDVKRLFRDPITGIEFEAYERFIMDAEYHLNRNFILRGSININEYLDFLNLPRRGFEEDDDTGWEISDGYCWIDFYHEEDPDGVVVICTEFPPDKFDSWHCYSRH